MENNLLDLYEKEQLSDFIQKHYDSQNPTRFLIEVIPQSMSVDVKISIVDDDNLHIQTSHVTSLIDWENYNWR